jgi:hypothetical protein
MFDWQNRSEFDFHQPSNDKKTPIKFDWQMFRWKEKSKFYCLLSDSSNHLWNVDFRSLGPTKCHDQRRIRRL